MAFFFFFYRNRRSTKAKRKAAKSSLERNSFDKSVNGRNAVASTLEDASDAPVGEEEDEEMEMEITEDMMAFFTTSLKHRMERGRQLLLLLQSH